MKLTPRNTVRTLQEAIALLTLIFAISTVGNAQQRLSDRDVEHLMGNLHDDVKAFQGPFKNALGKSSVRKTSQEKDDLALGRRLEKETDHMHRNFKHSRNSGTEFSTVSATAQQVDHVIHSLELQAGATEQWNKVQADLNALAPAFNLAP